MKQPKRTSDQTGKKIKREKDHSLRRLNFKHGLMDFFCLTALALFGYGGWFLSLHETENAVACFAVGVFAVLVTVLPARQIYREQWYLDKVKVSLGIDGTGLFPDALPVSDRQR